MQQSSGACTIRGASTLSVAECVPTGVASRTMGSYTTMDLREEINHRRGGEDNRIAIERHRERR
jgi:hypothetical protein